MDARRSRAAAVDTLRELLRGTIPTLSWTVDPEQYGPYLHIVELACTAASNRADLSPEDRIAAVLDILTDGCLGQAPRLARAIAPQIRAATARLRDAGYAVPGACQPADPRGHAIRLTRLGDLLQEPDDATDWLLDGVLPAGGFSLLAAKPKVGKSTLARCLALAVARGTALLQRPTAQGAVIYLALEEKRAEVRRHFRDMGASGADEIYIYAATAPVDALDQLRDIVAAMKPALLIVDPLFRFARVKDGNDYAQVTAALEPLLALARQSATHVLAVHHTTKADRHGGDGILGSTALFGSVDTAIILRRYERYRTIATVQRYGQDLDETVLCYDPETRTLTLGSSRADGEQAAMAEAIAAYLATQAEPVAEPQIDAEVDGRTQHKRTALRRLVRDGRVTRTGTGTRGDPYRYALGRANPSGNRHPMGSAPENPGDSPSQ